MNRRRTLGQRVTEELLAFPVVVAAAYTAGRLLADGGDWLTFALLVGAIWTVAMIVLPDEKTQPDPPIRVLRLAIVVTAWWIIGFIGRWGGSPLDWLLYWLVMVSVITVQVIKVRQWRGGPT